MKIKLKDFANKFVAEVDIPIDHAGRRAKVILYQGRAFLDSEFLKTFKEVRMHVVPELVNISDEVGEEIEQGTND